MGNILDLHDKLKTFLPNVYFQPPSNITMLYPCIVYEKQEKSREYGNDGIYLSNQGYQIMVIEKTPDSDVADRIESSFQYCKIDQYYTATNLHHTTLTLYY